MSHCKEQIRCHPLPHAYIVTYMPRGRDQVKEWDTCTYFHATSTSMISQNMPIMSVSQSVMLATRHTPHIANTLRSHPLNHLLPTVLDLRTHTTYGHDICTRSCIHIFPNRTRCMQVGAFTCHDRCPCSYTLHMGSIWIQSCLSVCVHSFLLRWSAHHVCAVKKLERQMSAVWVWGLHAHHQESQN